MKRSGYERAIPIARRTSSRTLRSKLPERTFGPAACKRRTSGSAGMALRGHGDAWHGARRSGSTGQRMIDHGPRRQEAPASRCRIAPTGTMSDPQDAADPPCPHRCSSSQVGRMVPLGQATQRCPRCRWTSEGSPARGDDDPSAPFRPSVRTCMTSPTPGTNSGQPLVPRHRGFDRSGLQGRHLVRCDAEGDASCLSR